MLSSWVVESKKCPWVLITSTIGHWRLDGLMRKPTNTCQIFKKVVPNFEFRFIISFNFKYTNQVKNVFNKSNIVSQLWLPKDKMILHQYVLYKKTTCPFEIKFSTDDYLQMYKTLQIFTNTFTLNTNKFTSIKVIKNPNVQTQSY
jgi:hypothetical protein